MTIPEFEYCRIKHNNSLKIIEWKFGQPQALVSSYLDKLRNFPPLKKRNSESLISCSVTIFALAGVFRSLQYHQDVPVHHT